MKSEIARLEAVVAGAAFETRKKKVVNVLKAALRNIKKTTKASKGGITSIHSETRAYYGKLFGFYQKATKAASVYELNAIVKSVKASRAERVAKVKAVRAKKVKAS